MIRILHIYPELLNLYGEYANLSILTRYLIEEGMEVEVTPLAFGEPLPTGYDMIYLGCGTESASLRALNALRPYRDVFLSYRKKGAMILATGNSLDLFGQSIADDRDGTFEGLKLFNFTVSRTHKTRYLGDAVLTCPLVSEKVIGFVNKCSIISGIETPLFRAEMGLGNDNVAPDEGMTDGNFFGTSLIGPLLIRNPAMCRLLMDRLYAICHLTPTAKADMSLQEKAYAAALSELSARIK